MDWISPLTGLLGVLVGGLITWRTSTTALDRQLQEAKEARRESERITVATGLSAALAALETQAAKTPPDTRRYADPDLTHEAIRREHRAEQEWEARWETLLRAVRMAALEVRDAPLRRRLLDATTYLQSLRMMEYAFPHANRAWFLRTAVDHLIECVYAWRRGDTPPPAHTALDDLRHSYELRVEEYESDARHEREEREGRQRERAAARRPLPPGEDRT
ncbi:hypothetical protein [Streptomyces sp. NPDC047123]|uniref:hypothetical protein n=1 Tax=Streptomyces sp. NPDC047123 TaxID=3155622 RepID=UPI0033F8EC5C